MNSLCGSGSFSSLRSWRTTRVHFTSVSRKSPNVPESSILNSRFISLL